MSVCLLAAGCTDRVIVNSGSLVDTQPPDDEEPPADDGPPDDEGPSDDDDGPPPDDDDDLPVECVDQLIPTNELPVSLVGLLAQGESRFQPSCIDTASAEVTLSFTAPRAANYVFSTQGSSFDTVLYALGPTCEPPERACNDDSNGDLTSQIGFGMAAGETTVIVIDGFGESGEWSLLVGESGTCPNEMLGSDPEIFIEGFLDGTQVNSVVPSCAGAGVDIVYGWTPPFSGRWRISTAGSSFDTVLAVFSADCESEIACNDDGPNDVSSVLDLDLEEGVPVAISVESFDSQNGRFQLSIFPS
ncbi:MAG: hypothetical protein KUG77_12025 [Nannocystaceae bacterium]|nr:hypothetical protein [Nannocystaceae bacterium]